MYGEEDVTLPYYLTIDGLERLEDEGIVADLEMFQDDENDRLAEHMAKRFYNLHKEWGFNPVLYTQVDSEVSDEIVYSKGLKYVNRTGIYLVVFTNPDLPPVCPHCLQPLYNVYERMGTRYQYNPEQKEYVKKQGWMEGRVEYECFRCGNDVTELFEDGVCNYKQS